MQENKIRIVQKMTSLFIFVLFYSFTCLSAQQTPTGTIKGHIFSTDPDAPSFADIFVGIDTVDNQSFSYGKTTKTDANADYTLTVPVTPDIGTVYNISVQDVNVPGTFHVFRQVGQNGVVGDPSVATLHVNEVATQDVEMVHIDAFLTGRVSDAFTGEPLQGVRITASHSTPNTQILTQTNDISFKATTNAQGRFSLGISSGNFRISAKFEGFRTSVEEIDLSEDEELILNFFLQPVSIPVIKKTKFLLQKVGK